jgi:cytochrome P450
MTTADDITAEHAQHCDFDRHAPDYRDQFEQITHDLHSRCPVAWSPRYGGHWVVSGHQELFDIARRADVLSNDHDPDGERQGYQGIGIPPATDRQGGFLEMDPPEQREYRRVLNPYLSPTAVARWKPMVDDLACACLNERIAEGRIDFVEDLANVVPAIVTMAVLGLPLRDWHVYCEPTHAFVYTHPESPDMPRVRQLQNQMTSRMYDSVRARRGERVPGVIDGLLQSTICGQPPTDDDVLGVLGLLIGGGFDTTTALTSHALEWLSQNPAERIRLREALDTLIDPATEEFLRFFTPAVGDARTVTQDCEIAGVNLREGDRIWLSWAMANRDPAMFPEPDQIQLDRKGNRHYSFGLGIHRCIGSNLARMMFKSMLSAVLDRIPDYHCVPGAADHYDTVGVINGMKHLPATFTPATPAGRSLEKTIEHWQQRCNDDKLAAPVVRSASS